MEDPDVCNATGSFGAFFQGMCKCVDKPVIAGQLVDMPIPKCTSGLISGKFYQ